MENEEPSFSTTLLETPPEVEEPATGLLPLALQWLLDNIAEASKRASRVYTIFVGVLAYCTLTKILRNNYSTKNGALYPWFLILPKRQLLWCGPH